MHNLIASDDLKQEFCWTVMGEPAPVFSADFGGCIMDANGNETLHLTNEHFIPLDDDAGTFKLYMGKEDLEIAFRNGPKGSFIINGQIKGYNRIPICKGTLQCKATVSTQS